MRNKHEQKLEETINQWIESMGFGRKLTESDLISSWENIAGKLIADQTHNIYIYNNKLFVKLKSAALRNELSYRKSEILQKILDYHGKKIVEDIVFLS